MKKIKDYTRKDISITAWDWVSVNAKFISKDWFKERNQVSFEDFTHSNNKECIAAWNMYLSDMKGIKKKEKAKLKECNCAEGMASKVEAIWKCKTHGNCWNGVKWDESNKCYKKL